MASAGACAAARARRASTTSITATLRPLPGRRPPSPTRFMAARFAILAWSLFCDLVPFPWISHMVQRETVSLISLILYVADIERLRWQARGCRASALQSRQQPARKTGILVPKMNTLYSFCTHAIGTARRTTTCQIRDARLQYAGLFFRSFCFFKGFSQGFLFIFAAGRRESRVMAISRSRKPH